MKNKILLMVLIFSTVLLKGQEVKINNNLVVEADGTMRMDGAATVFDDIMIFPDATSRGNTKAPVWGGVSETPFKKNGSSQGVFLWMFSESQEQELYFTVQLPHSYKIGSNIFPHVHWTSASGTPTGANVVWGLEYTVIAIGGNFPSTTILTANSLIPAIPGTTGVGQHIITPLGTISGTSLGISTILVCRLFRAATNASDTFANEVGLLGIDFHIEKDTEGSRQEYIK